MQVTYILKYKFESNKQITEKHFTFVILYYYCVTLVSKRGVHEAYLVPQQYWSGPQRNLTVITIGMRRQMTNMKTIYCPASRQDTPGSRFSPISRMSYRNVRCITRESMLLFNYHTAAFDPNSPWDPTVCIFHQQQWPTKHKESMQMRGCIIMATPPVPSPCTADPDPLTNSKTQYLLDQARVCGRLVIDVQTFGKTGTSYTVLPFICGKTADNTWLQVHLHQNGTPFVHKVLY